ncbi:unnamed protein product [Gongylonema pulchrum]|uniref:Uncharacterized protein n=1 Tax=Gongylonema pulchrum TaxID=637853 RepID=A0A183DSG4_9BILA|nr:unnamed protein product [Gongylonema pulchrum]
MPAAGPTYLRGGGSDEQQQQQQYPDFKDPAPPLVAEYNLHVTGLRERRCSDKLHFTFWFSGSSVLP